MSTSESVAPGRENARQKRRRMRRDAAIIREGDALVLFAGGKTYKEIAADLKVALSTAYELVKRGLARRAEMQGPAVEEARALFLLYIEQLLSAWMPRAMGKGLDADLRPIPPSEGAAKVVIQLLDRFADVNPGLRAALNINLEGDVPLTSLELVASIQAGLQRIADKERVVEGELAAAGTDLGRATGGDNRTAPPEIAARERKTAK